MQSGTSIIGTLIEGLHFIVLSKTEIQQGIVDGSASKLALVQDTNYMVEKTCHIAPHLGAFRPI